MKNPVIFVFLGKVKLTGEKILRQAKRLFSAGEIFTIEGEARETIAKIQANEGGLRLNRVNIYVIAAAEETDALSLVETAGENLRGKFCENFAAVDITLTVLLDESNDCDATETRNANTYKFLQGLTANDYNRIFLLSNKNEYGEILSEAKKKSLVVAAALPLLNTTQSQFNEALAAKAAARKQPLFASAGFWQQPPPRLDENFALHRLADELERNFFNLSSRGGETFKGKLPAVGGNGSSSRRHTPGYE
ncbi:MAG: hypothetical protein FWB96_11170, partial [Defluviitaleaceae bacterium]|nr:hypothetical protein [Defluviitaleaceae bacterium]